MQHTSRRRFLQAVQRGRGGRGERRSRRNFCLRAGAGVRPGNGAALVEIRRFRAGVGRAAEGQDRRTSVQKALGISLYGRNDQRRRRAGAHQLGDPGQDRSRHHDGGQQLGSALRRQCRRRQRHCRGPVGKAQGGYFETVARRRQRRQEMDRDAVHDPRRVVRQPHVVVRRGRHHGPEKFPQTWEEYRAVGKKLKAKESPATVRPWRMRSATGRRSGIPICGRGAARRSRPTARPLCSNSKETIESVKFAVRHVEGRVRRRRHVVGRRRQQPRLSRPTRSVRPATARRSICWRAASPTPT